MKPLLNSGKRAQCPSRQIGGKKICERCSDVRGKEKRCQCGALFVPTCIRWFSCETCLNRRKAAPDLIADEYRVHL